MMKGKVVLVNFPFDDLSSAKVRPAVCLTYPIGPNAHIVLGFITSRIFPVSLETDIIFDTRHPDFAASGLDKPSTLRLDHLITLRRSMIRRELGQLSAVTQGQISDKLCQLFTAL